MSESEPFFPPPQKKDAAPYRAPAGIAPTPAAPARSARTLVTRPESPADEAPLANVASRAAVKATVAAQPYLPVPGDEPLAESFLLRAGIRVAALATLAIAFGLMKLAVWLSDGGAKWPQAVIAVLGVVGILASPVILFVRVRRLLRSLFGRAGD